VVTYYRQRQKRQLPKGTLRLRLRQIIIQRVCKQVSPTRVFLTVGDEVTWGTIGAYERKMQLD
jgi:hypothetical protein